MFVFEVNVKSRLSSMPNTATLPSHVATLEIPKPVTAVALNSGDVLVIGSGSSLIARHALFK